MLERITYGIAWFVGKTFEKTVSAIAPVVVYAASLAFYASLGIGVDMATGGALSEYVGTEPLELNDLVDIFRYIAMN